MHPRRRAPCFIRRVFVYATIEIWDEQGRPVDVDCVVEIVVKTDGQMSGFWSDPERHANSTGDQGVLQVEITHQRNPHVEHSIRPS